MNRNNRIGCGKVRVLRKFTQCYLTALKHTNSVHTFHRPIHFVFSWCTLIKFINIYIEYLIIYNFYTFVQNLKNRNIRLCIRNFYYVQLDLFNISFIIILELNLLTII